MPFYGSVHATSWVTLRHPGGFSDNRVRSPRSARIVTPLARVAEIISLRRTAEMLLDTYVGNRAGARILGGQIRGHNDTMQAAIWLDPRGFTALSDRLPAKLRSRPATIISTARSPLIRRRWWRGAEIQRLGDGLLAVFPIDEYVGRMPAH